MNSKAFAFIGLIISLAIVGVLAVVVMNYTLGDRAVRNVSDAENVLELADDTAQLVNENNERLQEEIDEADAVPDPRQEEAPAEPPAPIQPDSHDCLPEQRGAEACIQVYDPVCAKVNVVCITTPCPPVEETFSNSCEACSNLLVESYVPGECSG